MRAEIIVFDGFEDLDAFGPAEALHEAGMEVRLVTAAPVDDVVSALGTRLVPAGTLSAAPALVVVPGGGWMTRSAAGAWEEARRGDLPRALAAAAEAGAVLASVCTGAFLLAAAGLLKGRPAVTNAGALDELAAGGAVVVPDARVVDDGNVVTSGGLTAGIDLGLRLVERFLGADRARETGRSLEYSPVGPVRRPPAPASGLLAEVAAIELPRTPLALAAHAAAREAEPEYLLNHSLRSYLFARLSAGARGWAAGADFDDEVLFTACVLHDLGLVASADTGRRFEVDGADAAADLLRTHGMAPDRTALVWEAIALHTSPQIAERRAPEVALTRSGIGLDFGRDAELVPEEVAAAVHAALPRRDLARRIVDDITGPARTRPDKAPTGSLAAQLLHERATAPHLTAIERGARAGRWGG